MPPVQHFGSILLVFDNRQSVFTLIRDFCTANNVGHQRIGNSVFLKSEGTQALVQLRNELSGRQIRHLLYFNTFDNGSDLYGYNVPAAAIDYAKTLIF